MPADADRQTALALQALRNSRSGSMTFAELRAAGIKHPAAVVYELELAGHRITPRPDGIGLGEDEPKNAPAPPRPRIRVRRRDDGHSDTQAT